jgi:hypothetical protein
MFEYLFDSSLENETTAECKSLAHQKGIKITNTSNWSESEKTSFYYSTLMPISIRFHQRMKGSVRTHKAGFIHFDGILVTDDQFYVRDEALKKLQEL